MFNKCIEAKRTPACMYIRSMQTSWYTYTCMNISHRNSQQITLEGDNFEISSLNYF